MSELNVRAIIFTKNIKTLDNELICLFPWNKTLLEEVAVVRDASAWVLENNVVDSLEEVMKKRSWCTYSASRSSRGQFSM